MKKLSLLLSMLMIVGMFGTTAFAAGTTDATIVLDVDKTTVEVGETVTITVGLTGDSNDYGINGTAKIVPQWDTEYFEYVDGSGEVDSSTFALTKATTVATNYVTSGYITFSQGVVADDGVVSGDQTFGSFQLKALKATDTTTAINLKSTTQVKILAGTTVSDRADVLEDTTVAVTIKEVQTGPTTETITATPLTYTEEDYLDEEAEEFVKDDSTAATAYYVEKTFTSGQTAYWSASWNGTPMKKEASMANLAGKAKLGIVFAVDATISNVALNVVTQ